MRNLKFILLIGIFVVIGQTKALAQSEKAYDKFKTYINGVVQRVENTPEANKKRAILNKSFDKLVTSFDKVSAMNIVSGKDQQAINRLRENITDKKNELNGLKGYQRITDSQLNNFAQYVKQDLEQADTTITISVTVLLLIIIILLLL